MIIAAKGALGSSSLTYRWIAAGASGNLATSDSATASSWTARTSSFGTSQINFVASNGFDMYVAVGDGGKIATSPDGITWTQRANPFGTNAINSVAYGGGYWVAVGGASTNNLATATDPTGTWTLRTSGFTNAVDQIAYGAGLWVAKGNGVRTATDPTGTWTSRTTSLSGALADFQNRYTPSIGIWTLGVDVLTANNQLESSTDGITWTSRSLPNATGGGDARITSTTNLIVIAYTSNTANCDIATSTDGTAFTDRTPAITGTICTGSAVDASGFMVFANGTSVQTSTDGITWTSRTGPTFTPSALCHSSNS